jgi:hypothetical protein
MESVVCLLCDWVVPSDTPDWGTIFEAHSLTCPQAALRSKPACLSARICQLVPCFRLLRSVHFKGHPKVQSTTGARKANKVTPKRDFNGFSKGSHCQQSRKRTFLQHRCATQSNCTMLPPNIRLCSPAGAHPRYHIWSGCARSKVCH